ncbi:response regulator [Pseudogracilibacillus sp. SO30301A]|uniref:response regulator n=1 Tax=Pseudogracilibacillus sp. SO30301A TaxID=3098291 RepID=UPI00300E579C
MTDITVVIVEDDPMVLEINREFLKAVPGFVIVGTAVNGKEAVKKIKELHPNLVLLDKYLPDISGIDVLVQLRTERIPCDVIMITAARDVGVIKEARRLGAVDYMVKPFRFERYKKSLQDYYRVTKMIANSEDLKQVEIDKWLGNTEDEEHLPKGLNKWTMKEIMLQLMKISVPITAEDLAQKVGMSRVTVRKYLDFLAEKEKVLIKLEYGKIGRPTNLYTFIK